MLLKLQEDINELSQNYTDLELYQLELKLIDFEKEIVKILNAKKFLVRPPVEKLKLKIKNIKDEIYNLGEEELADSINEITDKIDGIIDGQMTAGIGGAAIYLRNMREAAKKKREKNN